MRGLTTTEQSEKICVSNTTWELPNVGYGTELNFTENEEAIQPSHATHFLGIQGPTSYNDSRKLCAMWKLEGKFL